MRRAKDGDRSAVEYLYVRYAGDVRRQVARVMGDAHDAEDVTQDVFARLPKSIQRYEERGPEFRAWLLRVATNAALDERRRRRPLPMSDVHADRPNPAHEAQHDTVAALAEALGSLPEAQRVVLLLRHLAGLSPGEIAVRLGKSEDSIHCLHHRGRDSAKASLRRLGAAPTTGPR